MPPKNIPEVSYRRLEEDHVEDTDAKNNSSRSSKKEDKSSKISDTCCHSKTICGGLIVATAAIGAVLYWNSSKKAAERYKDTFSLPYFTIYIPKIGGFSTNLLFISSALFTLVGLLRDKKNSGEIAAGAIALSITSNISTLWVANGDALYAKDWLTTVSNWVGTAINLPVGYVSSCHLLSKQTLSAAQETQIKLLKYKKHLVRKNQDTDTDTLPKPNEILTPVVHIIKWPLLIVPLYWQNIGYTLSTYHAIDEWQPNTPGIVIGVLFAMVYLISQLGFTIKGHDFLNSFLDEILRYGIPVALKEANCLFIYLFIVASIAALFSGFGADDANFSCWDAYLANSTAISNNTFSNSTQTNQNSLLNSLQWLSGIVGNIGAAMGYNFLEVLSFMIEKLEGRYDRTLSYDDQLALIKLQQQIETIKISPKETGHIEKTGHEEDASRRRSCFGCCGYAA